MDAMQIALLTLAAVLVGMMIPVMAQLWLTLRGVREELHTMNAKLDPTLDEVRGLVTQVRSATQVATAVGAAVSAGVRAWRDRRDEADARTEVPGAPPQQERTP